MQNDRALRTATNKLQSQQLARDRQIDEALRAVMQHQQGRRFINWLLSLGKIGRNPYTGQALSTMFNCGELNTAQQLQARIIDLCPEQYLIMVKELEDERRSDAAYIDRARDDGDEDGADSITDQ